MSGPAMREPTTAPTTPSALHAVRAIARRRASSYSMSTLPKALAARAPAAPPCTTRAATRSSMLGASAQRTLVTPNARRLPRKTGRWPCLSAQTPPGCKSAPNARRYPLITQASHPRLPRSAAMGETATVMIVDSRRTRNWAAPATNRTFHTVKKVDFRFMKLDITRVTLFFSSQVELWAWNPICRRLYRRGQCAR